MLVRPMEGVRTGCDPFIIPASCFEDRRPREVGGGLQDREGTYLWSSEAPSIAVWRAVTGYDTQDC